MGKLYVVATPIGNLSDMTQRAINTLKEVDLILCEDTRHSLILLNHYNISNKLTSYHKFNEKEKTEYILNQLKDKDIALISDAGTPCISDPGEIIIKEAIKNNIEIVPVGGISAITTSLSASGLDTTSFSFYGFFPKENKDKKRLLKEISISNIRTYVFYESPKRIIKTLEYIFNELGSVKVALSSDLTKLHEKIYYGDINDVIKQLNNNPKSDLGEYTLIIEKEAKEEIKEQLSIEALLVDIIIKENISIKEAIDLLNKRYDNISKKDIYNASLNIKNLK